MNRLRRKLLMLCGPLFSQPKDDIRFSFGSQSRPVYNLTYSLASHLLLKIQIKALVSVVLSKPFSYGYDAILMGRIWLFCVRLIWYFRNLHFLKT